MIRCLNNSDIDYIIEKMKSFNVKYDIDSIINHPCNQYLIYDLNKPVGFLEYALYYDRIELNYIYVNEEYRRNKIAEKMLNHLILEYSKKIDNITLEVSTENIPAIRLYEKLGFQKINKREKYYSNGDDADVMIRRF